MPAPFAERTAPRPVRVRWPGAPHPAGPCPCCGLVFDAEEGHDVIVAPTPGPARFPAWVALTDDVAAGEAAISAGAAEWLAAAEAATPRGHRIIERIGRSAREAGRFDALDRSWRALLAQAHDIVTVISAEGKPMFASGALYRVLGYESAPTTFPAPYVHAEDRELALAAFAKIAQGNVGRAEYRVQHADGSWRWVEATGHNALDDPDIGGIIGVTRDVTERKQGEQRLHHLAFHDPLTDLPNRRVFFGAVARALEAGPAPGRPGGVVMVDVDRFKRINDRYGHGVGDRVLQEVAGRLVEVSGTDAVVARLGGDEFGICIPPGGPEPVAGIAEAVGRRMREPVRVGDVSLPVSVSVGAREISQELADPDALVAAADHLAYDHKRTGGRSRRDAPRT